jgi:hypothetical protein
MSRYGLLTPTSYPTSRLTPPTRWTVHWGSVMVMTPKVKRLRALIRMRDGRAEKLVGVVAAGRGSRHNLADRLPSDDELEAMYGMRLADESLVQARGLTAATEPGGCEAGDLLLVPDGAEVAQAPLRSAGRAPETDQ